VVLDPRDEVRDRADDVMTADIGHGGLSLPDLRESTR
jgi:hypothetical protein